MKAKAIIHIFNNNMKNCNNPTKNIEIDHETLETVHHNNINAADPLVLRIAVEQVVQK